MAETPVTPEQTSSANPLLSPSVNMEAFIWVTLLGLPAGLLFLIMDKLGG